MSDFVPIRRALISVSDKSDLIPFARALASFGVEIISTGGTAASLSAAGISVVPIDRVTGFPEMMDGRVKTLHPAIHGALLARRDRPSHMDAMRQHGITPIDLVCVNLYPFEETVRRSELESVSEEEVIEQIDIGGPSMLRSAAKNFDAVAVVTSPDQYDRVVADLRVHDGSLPLSLRRELAAAAFMRTAEYDTAISAWMGTRKSAPFPAMLRLNYSRRLELRYGENPHQHAALYADPATIETSVVSATMLHGKPLSYNNIADAAAALQLVQELHALDTTRTAAAIIKHANPCGAAVAADGPGAFSLAYEGDPLAAYGGILALSNTVDERLAEHITEGNKFLEVIVAPEFSERSAAMLGERWKNVRLLATGRFTPAAGRSVEYRSIPGGMLLQERDLKLSDANEWAHVAGPAPSSQLLADAAFIWIVAKHLKSNAVAIARDGQMLGGGMGQVDRVTACKLAIERAGARLRSSQMPAVAASDAFFPFPDGPRLLIDAGVRCLVHPGGSMRDQETIDLCAERGVTCLLTGVRHFRH